MRNKLMGFGKKEKNVKSNLPMSEMKDSIVGIPIAIATVSACKINGIFINLINANRRF